MQKDQCTCINYNDEPKGDIVQVISFCFVLFFSLCLWYIIFQSNYDGPFIIDRGRISSVGGAFDCRAGGRGFDSRGRTITQGLKMTEK